ncbi:MAG TPA: universal stress protein [Candidatus Limnocylindria bacterium]|nr:universal stress protein [Candidatus Limnocylindria bacterium]
MPLAEIRLKRILVPVDFSVTSRKALQYAVSFAKQFSAEIILLHVVQPPVYFEGVVIAAYDDTTIREASAKRLSEWRNETASGATVKANVRTGAPYHEIVLTAEETNTDLIIVGTHGRGGLARMLIGSTAERVVRHAPCPVLVVREREHDFVEESEGAAGKTTNRLKGGRYGNRPEEKRSGKSTTALRR